MFHFIVEDGVTFACMSDENFPRFLAFGYLDDVKDRFLGTYDREVIRNAIAFAMNEDFTRTLLQQMEYFNSPEANKFRATQNIIDETKEKMVDNIDKLVAREEQIQILVDKTDQLQTEALTLQDGAVSLKRHLWWKNMKVKIIIGIVILLALGLITGGIIWQVL